MNCRSKNINSYFAFNCAQLKSTEANGLWVLKENFFIIQIKSI